MAVAAAAQALADAGLDDHPGWRRERTGVAMGTTSGEPREVERFDDAYVGGRLEDIDAGVVETYPSQSIATSVAAGFDLEGPVTMIPAACAAGNYAVGYALDALRWGRAEVMLAGGADAFSRITYTGFARLGAVVARRCHARSTANRQGMIPGEGAGVLVLETLERARRRGARVYAEVAGYGMSCDAHHMTAAHPEGEGLARSILRRPRRRRGTRRPGELRQRSRHRDADQRQARDPGGAARLRRAGPADPDQLDQVDARPHDGSRVGTRGVACSLSIASGAVPPTINFREPDPECELDCVPNTARELAVEVAMNNAYAFGGNNATVVFRRLASLERSRER